MLDRMTKLTSLYLALSAHWQVLLIVYTRNNRLTVVITSARKQGYDHTYWTVTQDHESPDRRVKIIVARLMKYHPWHQPL